LRLIDLTSALNYKQTQNKQNNKHTRDNNEVSQTVSFKQSIDVNNKHIQ